MIARRRRRVRPRRAAAAERDQRESAFASILANLVKRVPGARAAALVDRDGETVDYSGGLDPFDVRLAAAHWRLVLDEVGGQRSFRSLRWLCLRAGRASYLVHELPEDYALVLILARAAGFFGWRRALSACAGALAHEAGWDERWAGAQWFPALVTPDDRRRPAFLRIAGHSTPVEIVGTVAGGLARRERAWRVRLDTGAEATLVREPGGMWYSDEPVEPQDSQKHGEKKRR
jgi:hypothetical protein